MSDASCAGRKVDRLGSPMTIQTAGIALPVPRHSVEHSTMDAVAPTAYTIIARILHWVMAILILFMIPLGHRSIGALIMSLILLRLIHRWAKPPALLPDDIPAIQQLASDATHWCLYALLLVQPIVGWMANSAYGEPIKLFGSLELPPIWPEDRLFSEQLFALHGLIGTVTAGFVAVHIGGALYHHLAACRT
jgi:cytochrome b561